MVDVTKRIKLTGAEEARMSTGRNHDKFISREDSKRAILQGMLKANLTFAGDRSGLLTSGVATWPFPATSSVHRKARLWWSASWFARCTTMACCAVTSAKAITLPPLASPQRVRSRLKHRRARN